MSLTTVRMSCIDFDALISMTDTGSEKGSSTASAQDVSVDVGELLLREWGLELS